MSETPDLDAMYQPSIIIIVLNFAAEVYGKPSPNWLEAEMIGNVIRLFKTH